MKVTTWVSLAIVADELLAILAFTSYVPYFLPNSFGLAIQNGLWAASLPVVLLTNVLGALFSPYLLGQGLAVHLAFFLSLAAFTGAALVVQRADTATFARVPPASLFSFGMLMTVAGAFADAYWHLTGLAAREGFFTPAHATIYSGVSIMLVSTLFLDVPRRVKATLRLAGLVVVAGGVWDFWWHSTYGFVDVVAWTPPHLTVTAGFVVLLATGLAKLGSLGRFPRFAFRATAALFVVLWSFVIALTLA